MTKAEKKAQKRLKDNSTYLVCVDGKEFNFGCWGYASMFIDLALHSTDHPHIIVERFEKVEEKVEEEEC